MYNHLFVGDAASLHHLARATAAAEAGAASSTAYSSSGDSTATTTTTSGEPLSPVNGGKLLDRFSPFLAPNLDGEQEGNFDDVYTWLHEPIGMERRGGGGNTKMDYDDSDMRLDFDTIMDDNTDHLTGFMLETLEVS